MGSDIVFSFGRVLPPRGRQKLNYCFVESMYGHTVLVHDSTHDSQLKENQLVFLEYNDSGQGHRARKCNPEPLQTNLDDILGMLLIPNPNLITHSVNWIKEHITDYFYSGKYKDADPNIGIRLLFAIKKYDISRLAGFYDSSREYNNDSMQDIICAVLDHFLGKIPYNRLTLEAMQVIQNLPQKIIQELKSKTILQDYPEFGWLIQNENSIPLTQHKRPKTHRCGSTIQRHPESKISREKKMEIEKEVRIKLEGTGIPFTIDEWGRILYGSGGFWLSHSYVNAIIENHGQ